MKNFIINSWGAVMDNRRNPLSHLDLASQHYTMQVLAWMWSMLFSLAFLSIFQFGYVWMAHLLVLGGCAMTVSVFRDAQQRSEESTAIAAELSRSSRCVWKIDSEA